VHVQSFNERAERYSNLIMSPKIKTNARRNYYLVVAVVVVIMGVMAKYTTAASSSGSVFSGVFRALRRAATNGHPHHHQYEARLFSRDPLIFYVDSFLSKEEIDHVLELRYVQLPKKEKETEKSNTSS